MFSTCLQRHPFDHQPTYRYLLPIDIVYGTLLGFVDRDDPVSNSGCASIGSSSSGDTCTCCKQDHHKKTYSTNDNTLKTTSHYFFHNFSLFFSIFLFLEVELLALFCFMY